MTLFLLLCRSHFLFHLCSLVMPSCRRSGVNVLTDCCVADELERELKGLQGQQGSQLTVYGQWVPQLLKKIDAAFARKLFKKKPVGPIGNDNAVMFTFSPCKSTHPHYPLQNCNALISYHFCIYSINSRSFSTFHFFISFSISHLHILL